jgi:hypothetical protein
LRCIHLDPAIIPATFVANALAGTQPWASTSPIGPATSGSDR